MSELGTRLRAKTSARTSRENLVGWALATPTALLVIIFFLVPTGLTLVMSFFDWPTFGTPEFIGGQNYVDILSDAKFGRAVTFSLVYTGITSVLGILLSLGLALMVRPGFPGRTAVRALLFAPVTIGFVPAGLLWLSMTNASTGVIPDIAKSFGFAESGIDWYADPTSTLAIVSAMTIWKTAGLAMLVLLIGIDSIPPEIYEASRLDGSGPLSTLTRITLPLIIKPLSLVVLLTIATTFLAFDQFFTMTKGGPANSTVTVVFYLYNAAFVGLNRGYAAAVAVIAVVMMLAFSAMQLRLQRGRAST